MPFRVVIPARYDSSRLPGKVLLPLAGKPMLQWVHERARDSKATEVVIATDDERIAEAARGFAADVAMTGRTHVSGTDRIAEVAAARGWQDDDIVVNVQGDEPLIPPAVIDQVAALLHAHARADIATLAARIDQVADLNDPNNVKVACDASGRALYFSRAPIPWNRDAVNTLTPASLRHIGIYAYRVAALRRLASLPASRLEQIEKLEQLRALENGMEIRVALACERPLADVNTAADLERAERALSVRP
ncbi:MAG TPA: 3-deoxy-manno-octulosonate cytidylyltransferase [Steroidobacteraceae bacterium]|jgi:3-deoxy-manno-octulosonate cytidylyltransferase (CMP-KDO synthetase)|nr:3-deoxy-manno-octulosonate cytidylyltransferase [Steroidobacteraceae bacterium]